ncbi:MAG: hypothetical protein ACLTPC_06000 [Lacrimispora saccharolytica]
MNAVMSFGGKADESIQGQVVCVDGGRLKRCGKSNRSEAPSERQDFLTSFQMPAVHAYHLTLDAFWS